MKTTIVRNARIGNNAYSQLHRLKVVNGCISEITEEGSTDTVHSDEINADTIIDVKGRVIFPGMQDAHIHVAMLGESLHYVNMIDCYSIEDIVKLLVQKVQDEPHLPFIIGFNWDHTKLGRLPHRGDIDSITDKPIFLWRACWHIGVANSAALALTDLLQNKSKEHLNLDKATGQWCHSFSGGAIDYDLDVLLPTGILRERACEPMMSALGKFKTRVTYLQFIREGLHVCLSKGITCVHTNDDHSLELYQNLQSQQLLPIRVLLTPNQQELTEEHSSHLVPFPLFLESEDCNAPTDAHLHSSRLGMNRVKIFSDGSLGAETAAMKLLQPNLPSTEAAPIENSTAFKGILMHTAEAMEEMVKVSTERGFRVEIHAIGDAAADQVVSTIDRVNSERTRAGFPKIFRPLVTHCQVLGERIIELMHEHDIIANIQPSFVPTDMRWVMSRMSDERQLRYAYAWKTLLHGNPNNVHCAGGSDAPIEDASPWYGVYDAMFRTNQWRLSGTANNSESTAAVVFRPEERLSFADALALYTTGAAYAAGYEKYVGQVAVGQVADLVVMNAPHETSETADSTEWSWLMTETPELVIIGGDITFVKRLDESSSKKSESVVIEKEDLASAAQRLQFESVLQQNAVDQSAKPIDASAPFIPGKGGNFGCVEKGSNAKGGRRGFCRCLLHMEYCG